MQPFTLDNCLGWKHQFQVFLATDNSRLGERKKLRLFLDCLGAEGLAIACKLFPELRNYKTRTAKKTVTFAQVWWQFNEHCWLKYNPQSDPSKDLLQDRAKLLQICEQEMDQVSEKYNWLS